LTKELDKIEKEFTNNQRQLSNEQFLAKAPQKVVDGLRSRAQELAGLREKIKRQLDGLNDTGTNA
jgi:valyl-tRNA synthetase